MSGSKSSDKPPIWLIFIMISALVTPPIAWAILVMHCKPEDRGHVIRETFKRPLTWAWICYAGLAIWVILKAYGS